MQITMNDVVSMEMYANGCKNIVNATMCGVRDVSNSLEKLVHKHVRRVHTFHHYNVQPYGSNIILITKCSIITIYLRMHHYNTQAH
jgi:hypothetical protein